MVLWSSENDILWRRGSNSFKDFLNTENYNLIPKFLIFAEKKLIDSDDAKWKIKENEWYLYGFDTLKLKLN
jgi:hypothetical protein